MQFLNVWQCSVSLLIMMVTWFFHVQNKRSEHECVCYCENMADISPLPTIKRITKWRGMILSLPLYLFIWSIWYLNVTKWCLTNSTQLCKCCKCDTRSDLCGVLWRKHASQVAGTKVAHVSLVFLQACFRHWKINPALTLLDKSNYSSSYGKIVGQTELFNLSMSTGLREGKLDSSQLTLCCILLMMEVLGE